MKIKQTALFLGLATFGLVSFAQDNKPDPAPVVPPPANTAPANPEPAKTDPAEQPAKTDPAAPAKPDSTEPAKADPAAPAKTDPADPAKVDPAAPAKPESTEPAKTDPAAPAKPDATDPAKADPAAPAKVDAEPPKAEVAAPQTQGLQVFAQAAPTNGAAATTPAPTNPNEIVPLIVIDDVPLTDAIRNLARQSNLNFQFDPRITGMGGDGKATNQPNVSIRFENVTSQEALQAVLDNYNLILARDPKSKIARVTVKDPKAEDPLFSRTIQLKYSDPTNMVLLIKSTLSKNSSVMADPRTSQLLVTTTEKEMDGVTSLISKLDSPTRQVLIEAQLIETTKSPSTVKGIDWSGSLQAQHFAFGNNAIGGVQGTPAQTSINPLTGVQQFIPGTPSVPGGILTDPKLLVDTAKGFNPATAFLNADGVSAVLSFLNKDGESEVVATPRAVTLDNQMARLEVTKSFPIFLITPGSANSPAGATITYTNLGTILSVTPRIAADKNITLTVVPEVSNIDHVESQTLNNTVNTANVYGIRRITTRVMIPSGNTLVMGGLINDTKTKDYIKVPLLGDIPILGLAFRHESKARTKQNLLIFITPTIVEDEAFHVTSSGDEFLKNRIIPKPDTEESAWDSGKPHDWSKPVN